MISAFALPEALREFIGREARAVFPRECCGLIEGVRRGGVVQATAAHPVRNLATEPDRFELDPSEHFRLLHALRGTGREIVGCYHSHPDGRAELSARDRQNGSEDEFIWLVVAATESGVTAWSASAFVGGDWREIELRLEAEQSCA
jgi:proteasome lid subunit RPN8/RPN11